MNTPTSTSAPDAAAHTITFCQPWTSEDEARRLDAELKDSNSDVAREASKERKHTRALAHYECPSVFDANFARALVGEYGDEDMREEARITLEYYRPIYKVSVYDSNDPRMQTTFDVSGTRHMAFVGHREREHGASLKFVSADTVDEFMDLATTANQTKTVLYAESVPGIGPLWFHWNYGLITDLHPYRHLRAKENSSATGRERMRNLENSLDILARTPAKMIVAQEYFAKRKSEYFAGSKELVEASSIWRAPLATADLFNQLYENFAANPDAGRDALKWAIYCYFTKRGLKCDIDAQERAAKAIEFLELPECTTCVDVSKCNHCYRHNSTFRNWLSKRASYDVRAMEVELSKEYARSLDIEGEPGTDDNGDEYEMNAAQYALERSEFHAYSAKERHLWNLTKNTSLRSSVTLSMDRKQRPVVEALMSGLGVQEIAKWLDVSPATVYRRAKRDGVGGFRAYTRVKRVNKKKLAASGVIASIEARADMEAAALRRAWLNQ